MFSFVKVSFLFADMNDDFRRPGDTLIIPPTCWSGAGIEAGRIRWILLATAYNQCDEACTYSLQQTARTHGSGYLCGFIRALQLKMSVLTGVPAVS
jgi:hypothetical protein